MINKQYSPSQFGRDAEFIIALYLISKGWQIKLSKNSRGPADLMAKKDLMILYIQIKASSKLPSIKGSNIMKLKNKSYLEGALPVIATLQPFIRFSNTKEEKITLSETSNTLDKKPIKKSIKKRNENRIEFKIYFYNLYDWSSLEI
ncbi:MAG TPA: hypothetical protein VFK40_08205 [Nitrososphaeraceae archaeon]|nr:hypothetical protein [Nitrososphaeraceae archaeon]